MEYFTDERDGQTYRTVKIGNTVWMAENLNYKTADSWCYDNKESNGKKYGRLYTYEAAKAACPAGWTLPISVHWESLAAYTGAISTAGYRLRARNGWDSVKDKSGYGNDLYGFSALPGGCRAADGSFRAVGLVGAWWVGGSGKGDKACYRLMCSDNDAVGEEESLISLGFSVRCVCRSNY